MDGLSYTTISEPAEPLARRRGSLDRYASLVHVKKNIIVLAPIAVIVLSILVFGLSSLSDERLNTLEWIAAICGVLGIAWIVAMLLNVALFAPVYWLLGKLQPRKSEKETGHRNDS